MRDHAIAIVGLSCRLPGGGTDLDSFWSFLQAAGDACSTVPPDRWSHDWYGGPKPRPGKTVTHAASFIPDIAGFDAGYFQLADEEAAATDPQHRLLLELSIEALEDAGLPQEEVRGRPVGVFVGLSDFSYAMLNLRDVESVAAHSHCTKHYMCPNRISNFLDLRGPSFVTDAACATSLVALHLACQSLRADECEAAICGAANVLIAPQFTVNFSLLGTLSTDGRSKPFDRGADGYGRGEGAVVVVLKRLRDALAANDRVYAVIRGTGTCHGGKGPLGPWAPRHEQQAALIRRVMQQAEVLPDELTYVEAHATGTQVGDREELLALHQAIGKERTTALPIGGIKGALGHAEAAAGITGVLKGLGIVRYGALPATRVDALRTDVMWEDLGLRIVGEYEPLPASSACRVVGVNSFGVGGSYAHAIIEQSPKAQHERSAGTLESTVQAPLLLPVSAHCADALTARIAQLSEYLSRAQPDFADVAYTLCRRRTHHDHRATVVAADNAQLRDGLAALRPESAPTSGSRQVVFVFSGTGGQWWKMGRELLQHEPLFRRAIQQFDEHWQRLDDWSIHGELLASEAASRIGRSTRHSTAAQVALQVALASVWEAWGIRPDKVIGHSLGELAAAWCCGALDLADVVALTKARCDWQDTVDGTGTMAAVALSESRALQLLQEHAPKVDIAGINAPNATTLAGSQADIRWVCQVLDALGVFSRALRVTVPFHSRFIRARHDTLTGMCPVVRPRTPRCTFVSAALGGRCDVPLDAAYWLMGFEQPVRFMAAVEHVVSGGDVPLFIEVGPHPVLGTSIEECLLGMRPSSKWTIVPSLRRNEPERAGLLKSAGKLFEQGHALNWTAIGVHEASVMSLPGYPWQHRTFWLESDASRHDRLRGFEHPLTGTFARDPNAARLVGTARLLPRMHPVLESHRIAGELVMPAAAFVEMLRVAAAFALGTPAVCLRNVSIDNALVLGADRAIQLRTAIDELERAIHVFSSADAGCSYTLHAQCRYSEAPQPPQAMGDSRPGDDSTAVDAETYYREQWTRGYQFGTHFQSLRAIERGPARSAAVLALADECSHDVVAASIVAIDAAFQAARIAGPSRYGDCLEIPVKIERVVFGELREVDGAMLAGTHCGTQFDVLTGQAELRSPQGVALACFDGIVRKVLPSASGMSWDAQSWLYKEELAECRFPEQSRRDPASLRVALVCREAVTASAIIGSLRDAGADTVVMQAIAPVASWLAAVDARQAIVVDLRPLEAAPSAPDQLSQALDTTAWDAIELLRQTTAHAANAELVFVVVDGGGTRGPQFGALIALSRVAEIEQPEMQLRVIGVQRGDAGTRIAAELCHAPGGEREILWSQGKRHAVRVHRLQDNAASSTTLIAEPARVCIDPRSQTLLWRRVSRGSVPANFVRVKVNFAALNFRDVMKLLGAYPAEPGDPDTAALGDECSGEVIAVGATVPELQVGDAVIVRSSGECLATEVCVPHAYVFRKPAALSDAQAATLPIVFSTAWYALHDIGRLAPGERVLIHSAAGGVGLAAIQIARSCGAEIFCTAGSEAKRKYLKSLGVEHVFSSKDLKFIDAIRAITAGQGVDVVLNSLAGVSMAQSLSLLRDFGRFIELGKRDLYADTSLGLYALRNNISYHAVDLAKLWRMRVSAARRLFETVLDRISRGELRPLPHRIFPAAELDAAFAYFRSGEHTGKLLIDLRVTSPEAVLPTAPATTRYREVIRADGCYLVTGGLGSVGRIVLTWLVNAGARHLVVLGRHADAPEAQPFLASLRTRGARVDVYPGSVADQGFVSAVLQSLRASGTQLRGVFHLAGILRDAVIPSVTRECVQEVFAAKVTGAWNLHLLTRHEPLDFFTLFSSAVAVAGAAGQAAYAMANAALDGLARWRRSLGLSAQSIGWGLFADTAMATGQVLALREQAGVAAINAHETECLLDRIVPMDEPHLMIRPVDWSKALRGTVPARFAALRPAQALCREDQPLGIKIRTADAAHAAQLIERYLLDTLARILAVPAERLTPTAALGTFGLNSLASINLQNRISYELGVSIGTLEFGAAATIERLCAAILARLGSHLQARSAAVPAQRRAAELMPLQRSYLRSMRQPVQETPRDIVLKAYDVTGKFEARFLEQTLQAITQRHEALRACFEREPDGWHQYILPQVTPRIGSLKARARSDVERALSALFSPWDISRECMIRCVVIEDEIEHKHSLVFAFSHLAFDRVSVWILEREIPLIYGAAARSTTLQLPPVATSFSEWCSKLYAHGDAGDIAAARAAIDMVVALGPRPVAPLRSFVRMLPPWQGRDASDGAMLRELMNIAAAHLQADGFLLMHNGRTSIQHPLAMTVGPLALAHLVGTDQVGTVSDEELTFEKAVAFGGAMAKCSDQDMHAFYTRMISINYGATAGARSDDPALVAWPADRVRSVVWRNAWQRSRRAASEPATDIIVGAITRLHLLNDQGKLMLVMETRDPSFKDETFDAIVQELL